MAFAPVFLAWSPAYAATPPDLDRLDQQLIASKVQNSLQSGVTFTPNVDGLLLVPLIITFVGPTEPGENRFISYEDQPVVAKTTEPIFLDAGTVLPTGTVFEGHVQQIVAPRRMAKNGYAILHFDTIINSKGQAIPIATEGVPKHYGRSQRIEAAINVADGALSGALIGATIGAGFSVIVLLMDPNHAVFTYFGCVIAGAAVGGLLGAAYGLSKKGDDAISTLARQVLVPVGGDTLKQAAIPWEAVETLQAPVVFKSVVTKSLTNPYRLQVEALVVNDADEPIESSDLVLTNTRGDRFPIALGNEHNSPTNFTVPPHSVRHFWADFDPEMPESGSSLVWYRHLSGFRDTLVEFKLP